MTFNHLQIMNLFYSTILNLSLTVVFTSLFTRSVLASDQKDLIDLRNSWNQQITELPREPPKTQCSGLSLMRALAEGFMSRHNDARYAQTYNSLLDRYSCLSLAKLEYFPNSQMDESIQESLAQDGSCLTLSEILRAKNAIEKQCQKAYIYIKTH